MIGIACGLLYVLLIESGCISFINSEFIYTQYSDKVPFLMNATQFSIVVIFVYLFYILSIARLVRGKYIFPSLVLIAIIGVCYILYFAMLFSFKSPIFALIFCIIFLALSHILYARFLLKDIVLSFIFLPILIFNTYCYLVTSGMAI